MKRFILCLGLAVGLAVAPAYAHDAYDDSEANPLRIAAYAVNPVGYAIEWIAMRPLHFLVSQPALERMFGHAPHESPFGGYEAYEPEPR